MTYRLAQMTMMPDRLLPLASADPPVSAKLEAAIKAEIGVDDGREMPEIPKVTWYMDTADL